MLITLPVFFYRRYLYISPPYSHLYAYTVVQDAAAGMISTALAVLPMKKA